MPASSLSLTRDLKKINMLGKLFQRKKSLKKCPKKKKPPKTAQKAGKRPFQVQFCTAKGRH